MFARARPLWGPSASAPNQNGCATRFAQTVLARIVDSGLRFRRTQGGKPKGLLFAILMLWGESPETVFGTAQFEEKQTNFAHAKELYQQIIRDHPDSEWAKKAKERFKALEDLYPED